MAESPIVANRSGGGATPNGAFDSRIFLPPNRVKWASWGWVEGLLSLLLFVAGYLMLATLEPLVAAGPALTSFVAAMLLLAREPAAARI